MRRLGFYTIAVAASAVATAVLGDAALRLNVARRERLGQLPSQAIASLGESAEIVLVFVGGVNCQASGTKAMQQYLTEAVAELTAVTEAEGWRFRFVGVAQSTDPREGVAFLNRMGQGQFDEMVVGGSRAGTGLLRYVIVDFPGPSFTPQLVVLFRQYGSGSRLVNEEVQILRLVGSLEISRWIAGGATLPGDLLKHQPKNEAGSGKTWTSTPATNGPGRQ